MYSLYLTAFIHNQKWRAGREVLYFFFLTDYCKLCSQEVYAVAQQRILHVFVFMSCKPIFLPSAADHWGCWLNTALKYSQTLFFLFCKDLKELLIVSSHLLSNPDHSVHLNMLLDSDGILLLYYFFSSSYWNGHQDKDCWPCSFFSFLTGIWWRANRIFKVVTDCHFFK